MRIGIIIVMVCLLAGLAWGQVEIEWERVYGDGYCNAILETPDGGFFLVGANQIDYPIKEAFILRIDSNGDSRWIRRFAGSNSELVSIIETSDGGYALAGVNEERFWLLRIDENGDSLWSRTYVAGIYPYCSTILQTADGSFLLAGRARYLIFILKVNANGDSLWSNYFRGERVEPPINPAAACFAAVQAPDGGFALAGWYWTRLFGNQFVRPYFMKADSSGRFIWSAHVDNYHPGFCNSVVLREGGGFALTKKIGNDGYYDEGFVLDFISEIGERIRSTLFQSFSFGFDMIKSEDGGFVLAGLSSIDGRISGLRILKTDENGDSLWSNTFDREGASYNTIIQTTDGSFLLGGYVVSDEGNHLIRLLKTTPDPVRVPESEFTLHPSAFNLTPYPNPFNSAVHIDFSFASAGFATLEVFDVSGRRIKALANCWFAPGSYNTVWDASDQPSGVYLAKLDGPSGVRFKKLVLMR